MKIEVKNEEYRFITDNSREVDSESAFLITEQNKIYKKSVEEKGGAFFLTLTELFSKWELGDIKLIGVTGTNGKTSVTNIIAHILKSLGKKVAVSGTEGIFIHSKEGIEKIVERGITTPDIFSTFINLKKSKESGAKFFVMEVSSHGIFQKRIEGLKFTVKVFTNLTQDHLDFHKTFEEYARVKSSFFKDSESVKIINADDNYIEYNKENTFTYAIEKTVKPNLKGISFLAKNTNFQNGISSDIYFKGKKYILTSPMIGRFNLYNILAAVGAVESLTSFDFANVIESVSDFCGVDGRMEMIYRNKKDTSVIEVFTDYAHTPDAIENVLKAVAKEKTITITIVGAGGDRDSEKRPPMAKAACENSDFVFITSDNPRFENPQNILDDLKKGTEGFKNYEVICDRKEATKKALTKSQEIFEKGESIIVAVLGKGNEDYLDVEGVKKPYSDKEEILSYFKS